MKWKEEVTKPKFKLDYNMPTEKAAAMYREAEPALKVLAKALDAVGKDTGELLRLTLKDLGKVDGYSIDGDLSTRAESLGKKGYLGIIARASAQFDMADVLIKEGVKELDKQIRKVQREGDADKVKSLEKDQKLIKDLPDIFAKHTLLPKGFIQEQ